MKSEIGENPINGPRATREAIFLGPIASSRELNKNNFDSILFSPTGNCCQTAKLEPTKILLRNCVVTDEIIVVLNIIGCVMSNKNLVTRSLKSNHVQISTFVLCSIRSTDLHP